MAANPLKTLRSANLKKLKLTAKELAEQHGRSYPYWQGLLNGSRPFAEKAARSIEDDMGLPRGWLDQPNASVPDAAMPFRDLSPEEGALIQMFRELGKVGGREAQEEAALEVNRRISLVNANLAEPVASAADPFAKTRGKLFVQEPAKKPSKPTKGAKT